MSDKDKPKPKSKSKSKRGSVAASAAMGRHEEEEEEEEEEEAISHHILVAQIIEKTITPIFEGHFLAVIGNWALPDFMKVRERPPSLVPDGIIEPSSDSSASTVDNKRDSSNVDMLCILSHDPTLRGLSYIENTQIQFGYIEDGISKLRDVVAPLKKNHKICAGADKPDEMCTLKSAVSLSVSKADDDDILTPRYLFPGMIVKFMYQGKPLVTFSIEINTGIDTTMLQANIAPCKQPRLVFPRVNIYGMAILLYYGMLDNVVKLRWDFDDMMTKCHQHLEAHRLGGVNPRHIIEDDLEPPSANFIVELIGRCNFIFRECIILDYRYTGKNMLEYLLKLFNPEISAEQHLPPVHDVVFGSYNKFESEQVGNRVLGLAYGMVDGIRVSIREAINATIGNIDRAITPLGGVIVKSGGEVAVYRGLNAEGLDASFSTNDIDTKVWVTKPANRDQIYEIITDMLFALVKYIAHYKFMDNFIRDHRVQFPSGIGTFMFGKCINCNVLPLDDVNPGMLSASARIIHINPHNHKRTSHDRKKITLLSMDTFAVTTYRIGDYHHAGRQFTVGAECSGYLVASPLDIAFDIKPFKVESVAEIPRHAQHGSPASRALASAAPQHGWLAASAAPQRLAASAAPQHGWSAASAAPQHGWLAASAAPQHGWSAASAAPQHGWSAASAAPQHGWPAARAVVSEVPKHGWRELSLPKSEPVKAKILSNAYMVADIGHLLHNADRLAIPGKTEKDKQRQAFFGNDPSFRDDMVRGGVSVVEMLTSGYDGVVGLDELYGVRRPAWCTDMEPFFASERVLFLAAIHDTDSRHKTPKNPTNPEKEENHRNYAEGGGNAVLNKINIRTRRSVKNYKQKSNKLTRNKKRRSYKSS